MKINIKPLLRTDEYSLFKWTKNGIMINYKGGLFNLSKMEVIEVIEFLNNLLDEEITTQQKEDIEEVLNEYKKENKDDENI